MNVHISYKMAKTPDVEREFQHQLQKLGFRVQIYRPELVHLHAIVDHGAPRGMMVSLNLRLPSGQLAAQEKAPTAVAAAKRAFAELAKQLTRHKEQLRGIQGRRRGRKGNGKTSASFEQTTAAVHPQAASSADVSQYIDVNAAQLLRFVQREIRFRVSTGQLEEDQLTPEEVLDEAVSMALSEERSKPEAVAIGRWLYRLAIEAINTVAAQSPDPAAVHLEDSARRRNVLASDDSVLQYHQPDEAILGETVIADRRVSTPEEIASSDEFILLMERALIGAPREEREAFVLYSIEGFTVAEIAAVSNRTGAQVEASLHSALAHLKRNMRVPSPFKERLLQATRIA